MLLHISRLKPNPSGWVGSITIKGHYSTAVEQEITRKWGEGIYIIHGIGNDLVFQKK